MYKRHNCLVMCFTSTCLITIAMGAFSQTKTPADSTTGDKATIEAQVEKYRKAFEAKDVNAIMAAYAPGKQLFVFDVVPPREYSGWNAYKKDWEELFAAFPGPIKDTISELNISVVGPIAYSHRIEDTRLTKKDGTTQEVTVRVTDIYRKLNGKWLVVHEHVSVPVDLSTGKPDLLSKP